MCVRVRVRARVSKVPDEFSFVSFSIWEICVITVGSLLSSSTLPPTAMCVIMRTIVQQHRPMESTDVFIIIKTYYFIRIRVKFDF